MNWVLLGTIIGYVAIVESLMIYVSQKRTVILILREVSNILWMLNNLFLGLYTGALLWGVAFIRDAIYMCRLKYKWANSYVWPCVFIAMLAISPIVSWQGPISLVPAIGSIFNVLGGFMKSPMTMRLFLFPCEILWIIYAIVSGNIPLIISESFLLLSAVLGVIRSIIEHYRNKKANAVQEIEKQNE
jgi:hypothetical protein